MRITLQSLLEDFPCDGPSRRLKSSSGNNQTTEVSDRNAPLAKDPKRQKLQADLKPVASEVFAAVAEAMGKKPAELARAGAAAICDLVKLGLVPDYVAKSDDPKFWKRIKDQLEMSYAAHEKMLLIREREGHQALIRGLEKTGS